MSHTNLARGSSPAVLALAGLWLAAAQAATPIDEIRPVSADAAIRVQNVSGSVEVAGWDRDEVHVTGELGESVEELRIEGGGGSLSVKVVHPENARNIEATHLRLQVPHRALMEVETVSADIDVSGLSGDSLALKSVSGDVTAEAETGDLRINSVSGRLAFGGSAGNARLETVSGGIEAGRLSGEVFVNTVSGDVKLEELAASRLVMETVSGRLKVSQTSPDFSEIRIKSLSGEVDLALPASLSAVIEGKSFSGRFDGDFGRAGSDGRRLNTRIGDGKSRVELETFSGNVTITRR